MHLMAGLVVSGPLYKEQKRSWQYTPMELITRIHRDLVYAQWQSVNAENFVVKLFLFHLVSRYLVGPGTAGRISTVGSGGPAAAPVPHLHQLEELRPRHHRRQHRRGLLHDRLSAPRVDPAAVQLVG